MHKMHLHIVFKFHEYCQDEAETLQWHHDGHNGVSNHQPHDSLTNCLFRRRLKKNITAPRYWPLCGKFNGHRWIPCTKTSKAENVSIWWLHHDIPIWMPRGYPAVSDVVYYPDLSMHVLLGISYCTYVFELHIHGLMRLNYIAMHIEVWFFCMKIETIWL